MPSQYPSRETSVSMSKEARQAVWEIRLMMIRKYGRMFTLSEALIQAKQDLENGT